jgi:nuclear pore complex protein Nup107
MQLTPASTQLLIPMLTTQAVGNSPFTMSSKTDATTSKDDPLQPLRAMADRVGKEVERFAEQVDDWRMKGSDNEKTRYKATVVMVGKFKDIADSKVKELKKQSGAENRGALQKSLHRRIQDMADSEHPHPEGSLDMSIQSPVLSIEPSTTRVQELRQWEAEAATWDLLQTIVNHYHPEPGTDAAANKRERLARVGGAYRYSPNQEIWDRFLLEDDPAKEKELVMKWLERTASNSESDIESIKEQLEAQSGRDTGIWTSGWLDTKSKIKHVKRMTATDRPLPADYPGLKIEDRTKSLITQLDPDAPGRQKRSLEQSDEYYDRALWMITYEMLRRGVSWKEVSEWCKERSEGWRGVSIGAANNSHSGRGPNLAGPTAGYLFRRMCFYAAQGASTRYESAVYGLLCGDAKTVEAVCRSWEDHLYARYNSLLLSRFDGYLTKNHPQKISQTLAQKFNFHDVVPDYGDWSDSSSKVMYLLRQQKSTAAQATLPIKLIQSSLISRNVDELLTKVGGALSILFSDDQRHGNLIATPKDLSQVDAQPGDAQRRLEETEKYYQAFATDPNALRMLVHMYIVFVEGLRHSEIMQGKDQFAKACARNVVVAYIEFLRLTKRILTIPVYAAQLGAHHSESALGLILPDIRNEEEQKEFISLIKQHGMNTTSVVQLGYEHQAKRLFSSNPASFISKYDILEPTGERDYLWPGMRVKGVFAGLEIEPRDEELIDSLRWVVHLKDNVYESFECLQSGLMYLLGKKSFPLGLYAQTDAYQ